MRVYFEQSAFMKSKRAADRLGVDIVDVLGRLALLWNGSQVEETTEATL